MDVVISQPAPDKIQVLPHRQYVTSDHLTPHTVAHSPLDQFRGWFKEVVEGGVKEAEAMTLSTVTTSGVPSARIVLLKQVDSRGFVFFTNYASRKSQELTANPRAALVFYWREVHRSVRVVGRESEEYFKSRPVGSRLGAWASKQSTAIGEGSRGDIPTPDFWGGWRVIPDEVEFWSGKPSRLHDRIVYLREEGSSDEHPTWKIERLSP
ncbi:hypothetical protein BDZ97DRAFT_1982526 [Flammula alnicola]|nr:hypothetical protein BDZ97DRAFT_1982526 [Flammula alnicola]